MEDFWDWVKSQNVIGWNFNYGYSIKRNTFYEDWMEVFDKLLPPLR